MKNREEASAIAVCSTKNRGSRSGIGESACRALSMIFCVALTAALSSCRSRPSPSPKSLAEMDPASMTSDELAHFVFEHHGCDNCHTLGKGGKLGFTNRGKEVGQNFEGCISLLTSMNVIAQVKEENRSAEEKRKAGRFQEFGCTFCHQVTPGKLGLTPVGSKLASLHMACTDVQRTFERALRSMGGSEEPGFYI